MSFLAALQFLTSIPVLSRREAGREQQGQATAYFPVVGLIIGLILIFLNWLLNLILPASVVNALLIAAIVIVTGALHLDGFADTCDGIAGHKAVEERWKVMRDSRTGAFGVVGIVLLLLIKYVALNSVPDTFMLATLLFMPVVSRWAMVYVLFTFKYARESGLGTDFKKSTRWPQFTSATIITVATALALFPLFAVAGLLIIIGVWIIITGFSFYLSNKFQGLTGDTYGAINEVAETITLLMGAVIFQYIGII